MTHVLCPKQTKVTLLPKKFYNCFVQRSSSSSNDCRSALFVHSSIGRLQHNMFGGHANDVLRVAEMLSADLRDLVVFKFRISRLCVYTPLYLYLFFSCTPFASASSAVFYFSPACFHFATSYPLINMAIITQIGHQPVWLPILLVVS